MVKRYSMVGGVQRSIYNLHDSIHVRMFGSSYVSDAAYFIITLYYSSHVIHASKVCYLLLRNNTCVTMHADCRCSSKLVIRNHRLTYASLHGNFFAEGGLDSERSLCSVEKYLVKFADRLS